MFPEDHLVQGLTGRNLEGQVTKDYHRIEKGLALLEPKLPFGLTVAERLAQLTPNHEPVPPYVGHARTALSALLRWNSGDGVDDDVSPLRKTSSAAVAEPEAFFTSRHSVRSFSDRLVEPTLLERAVALAIHSPSVCNRQAWHVRFYEGDRTSTVLRYQNGNAGFGESIPVVALVTVDARLLSGSGERNQGWIEGGIFSMSLVWAAHAVGLDTCMLNMSVDSDVLDRLRSELDIPDHELVIMMIAIGHGRDGHRVARSPRRLVSEVIRRPLRPSTTPNDFQIS
ncbi:nitroreductase family protein [Nocardioides sp. LS1]|uniref:nitroreductase family protein n=1 Tax=Nocardioides sp. LS1 TaxID=1027620 RepID=UPI000F6169C6